MRKARRPPSEAPAELLLPLLPKRAGECGDRRRAAVGSFLVRFRAKTAIAGGERGFFGSFWRKKKNLAVPRTLVIRADRGCLWKERAR